MSGRADELRPSVFARYDRSIREPHVAHTLGRRPRLIVDAGNVQLDIGEAMEQAIGALIRSKRHSSDLVE